MAQDLCGGDVVVGGPFDGALPDGGDLSGVGSAPPGAVADVAHDLVRGGVFGADVPDESVVLGPGGVQVGLRPGVAAGDPLSGVFLRLGEAGQGCAGVGASAGRVEGVGLAVEVAGVEFVQGCAFDAALGEAVSLAAVRATAR
ncbi:hypothetical protein [Embleya sp. AB8]|uniref:hypothetical protein n=1 Tax=Embleya sp. AB8 TaxID=3156304 RepID=UPI003C75E2EB